MAVARPNGFEIDFVRNLISGSAAWFFVIILKFIFTPIFELKIYEKKSQRPYHQPRQYLTPPAWEFISPVLFVSAVWLHLNPNFSNLNCSTRKFLLLKSKRILNIWNVWIEFDDDKFDRILHIQWHLFSHYRKSLRILSIFITWSSRIISPKSDFANDSSLISVDLFYFWKIGRGIQEKIRRVCLNLSIR